MIFLANDAKLLKKIRVMSESNISRRLLWGKIFLFLCAVSIVLFGYTLVRKYLGFSSGNTSVRLEMYALVVLVTFSMGFGSIEIGRLLRIIKYLDNREKQR